MVLTANITAMKAIMVLVVTVHVIAPFKCKKLLYVLYFEYSKLKFD